MSARSPLFIFMSFSGAESRLMGKVLKFFRFAPGYSYLHLGEDPEIMSGSIPKPISHVSQAGDPGFYRMNMDDFPISDAIAALMLEYKSIAIISVTSETHTQVRLITDKMVGSNQESEKSGEVYAATPTNSASIQTFLLCSVNESIEPVMIFRRWSDLHYRLINKSKLLMNSTSDSSCTLDDVALSGKAPPYSMFATLYDRYMSHVNYDHWIKSVLAWYQAYADLPLSSIYELACGTANIGSRFVAMGYHVEASDFSPYMLMVADEKPSKPLLSCQDMLDPLPESRFTLILCMFDSLNYLTDDKDVNSLLNNVHRSLVTGGLFVFDISTRKNSLDNFNDMVNISDTLRDFLVHKSHYNEFNREQITRLTLFHKQDDYYIRYDEKHTQRVYTNAEICAIIAKSPMKLLAIHSLNSPQNYLGKRKRSIDQEHTRLFYILQKQ